MASETASICGAVSVIISRKTALASATNQEGPLPPSKTYQNGVYFADTTSHFVPYVGVCWCSMWFVDSADAILKPLLPVLLCYKQNGWSSRKLYVNHPLFCEIWLVVLVCEGSNISVKIINQFEFSKWGNCDFKESGATSMP